MGVVLRDGARLSVYEAVGPVKLTPLESWVARGDGKKVLVKRLRPPHGPLQPDALLRLKAAAEPFRGKPYDFVFGWSDDRIYCSELVWKMYKQALGIELGALQRVGDFDLSSPEVKRKLAERYGQAIPLEEPAISPAAIAASPWLETVVDMGSPQAIPHDGG